MTLLTPHEEPLTQQSPQRDLWSAESPRPRRATHRRAISALVALIGLLIWAASVSPQVVALAPQFSNFSSMTTRWLSDATTLARSGQPPAGRPSGAAMGSVNTPQACSSQNASAFGSNLVIPTDTWVCGDALAVGGNLTVQGHVQGSAQAIGGNVTISGEVDGAVTAIGGDITVLAGALTHGKLDAVGGHVIIAPGAITQAPAPDQTSDWYGGPRPPTSFHLLAPEASSFWLGLLFWASAAIGLTAFVPEAVGHVRYTIARRLLLSGVSGAVIGFVGVLLGAALFLTCLGIPVTVAIALAMWLAWVVGTVAFGSWLGASLLRGMRHNHEPSLMASTLLGVLLLSLLKALPIAGAVVSVIVGCVALGATTLTLLSARRVSYARLRW